MSETTYSDQEKREAKARLDALWALMIDNPTTTDTCDYYDAWASTYDKDLDILGYNGPRIAGEYFAKYAKQMGIGKDAKILDVAAGTGKVGEKLLKDHGFWNLEANDLNEMMLNAARKKGIYKQLHAGPCEDFSLPEKSYDGVVIVGYCNLRCVSGMVKLIRSGGLFVAVYNNKMVEIDQKYLDEMDKIGVWQCLEDEIYPQKYYLDYDARVLVYKIV